MQALEFLTPTRLTVIVEGRTRPLWGLHGGGDGALGVTSLISHGQTVQLDVKTVLTVDPGDVLRIESPGGGRTGRAQRVRCALHTCPNGHGERL